jgi:hypothetical protein
MLKDKFLNQDIINNEEAKPVGGMERSETKLN